VEGFKGTNCPLGVPRDEAPGRRGLRGEALSLRKIDKL